MISCAFLCNAQQHTATVTEDLGDDQFIAVFNGREYRMIGAAKVAELAKQKIQLDICKANETRRIQLLEIADRDVTIAEQQRDIARLNHAHMMALYEKERELRQEAMSFAPVSGTPKGFGGWLLKAVNSPYGAVGFRLLMPTAQFIKVMRK